MVNTEIAIGMRTADCDPSAANAADGIRRVIGAIVLRLSLDFVNQELIFEGNMIFG